MVRFDGGMKATGYRGGFQIDAATADLTRLTEETDELPPEGNMCRAGTAIDYHIVPIGSGQLLIPSRSELHTLSPNMNETKSVTTYSACHEYAAESSLRFDDADDAASASKAPVAGTLALPPGVLLTLSLLTPIDAATAAAGDPVSAKVLKPARAPVHTTDAKEILIPGGAIAHGRILQMRHQYTSSQFLISIAFDTLEMNGTVSPIAIQLEKDLKAETRTQKEIRSRLPGFTLPVSSNEKGGLFTMPAKTGGYVMPAGFESTWITLAKMTSNVQPCFQSRDVGPPLVAASRLQPALLPRPCFSTKRALSRDQAALAPRERTRRATGRVSWKVQ
jgi:hypothetical protein